MSSTKTTKKRPASSAEIPAADPSALAPPEFKRKGKHIFKQKKPSKRGGRPSKLVEPTVRKLEAAFTNDFTMHEAWDYAGISKDTYYKWLKKYPQFSDRMRRAQQYPLTLAKRAVIGQMKGDDEHRPDGHLGLRFLERRQPERYRPRIDPEDLPIPPITVILPGQKPHPRLTPPKKDARGN